MPGYPNVEGYGERTPEYDGKYLDDAYLDPAVKFAKGGDPEAAVKLVEKENKAKAKLEKTLENKTEDRNKELEAENAELKSQLANVPNDFKPEVAEVSDETEARPDLVDDPAHSDGQGTQVNPLVEDDSKVKFE